MLIFPSWLHQTQCHYWHSPLVVPLILTRTHKRRFQQAGHCDLCSRPSAASPVRSAGQSSLTMLLSWWRAVPKEDRPGASTPSEHNPIHVDLFSMRTRESSNTAPTVSLSTASGHHSVKFGGTHPSQATTGRLRLRNIRIRYSGARRAADRRSTCRARRRSSLHVRQPGVSRRQAIFIKSTP